METGLTDRDTFLVVVEYVACFQPTVTYFRDWKVESLSLEDQVFMTLMKLRQNYNCLHFSTAARQQLVTISTFVDVTHQLLVKDVVLFQPLKEPFADALTFLQFPDCRMIINCTDV